MSGRRLKLFIFLICLSIGALPSAPAKGAPAQSPSSRNTVQGTVRFDLFRGYLMVAKGSIGPLKGLYFLLDTGTSTTLVDTRIASRLNMEGVPEAVNVVFYQGEVQAFHSWAPSIELGPLRQFHRPVLVQDLSMFDAALPVHIDAVIGLDVLGKTPFEVDYRRCRIHFGHLPHLPVSIPLRAEQGLAMVNVEVNHAIANLIFDTGTPSLMIFGSRIPEAIAGLKTHRLQSDANPSGNSECKAVHLPKMRLGQAEFIRQQAILQEIRDEGGRDFDGVLSPAALGIEAFIVDLESGALEIRLGM